MFIRTTLMMFVSLSALAIGGCASTTMEKAAVATVDPDRMNAHVQVLASDAFGGRGPTTQDETRTVEYIADQFEALGLEPAGENGTWFQTVPINRFLHDGPATFTAKTPKGSQTLTRATQVIVGSHRPADRITISDAPLVFVGYGVTAPERQWDDFKGVDLKGKIMVVLVNDPDFETPAGHPTADLFDGQGMTYYGRWTYKFEEAARQGAAGVLVIHETAAAGYPWSTLQNSSTAAGLDIVRADVEAERVQAQGWIQQAVAEGLFQSAGLNFATLKAAAQRADFRPVPLEGVSMSLDFGQTYERTQSRNVMARVTGATHPDETVMFGAHWDAHGHATANAAGDDIYNGAVDNASGVAGLLELARLFVEGDKPQRSVMFVSWAAEEAGLLGAYHYAANPLAQLETTVANLNMDSLLPGDLEPDVVVIGYGKTDAQALLETEATAVGRRLIPDPAPQVGAFYRSDHFPLAQVGVPALFAAAGFTGATERSRAYVRDRYHQPTDAWDPSWTMTGAAQDVQLLYSVGRKLADSRAWPRWTPGNEFEAVRETSAAARR